MTSSLACLGVFGPKARALLQPLTTTDLSNAAFGYMRAQEITVGSVPCLAVRVTYVGELGWELYCPAEFGGRLWDTIWAAGAPHGLVAAGYKAIDSLRLEKGYRVWGADITPEDSPLAAGLGFAVKLDKGEFLGRDALLACPQPESVLCCLDARRPACGRPRFRAGAASASGRSAGSRAAATATPSSARSPTRTYRPTTPGSAPASTVEIFGDRVGGEVAAEPLYDPAAERVRA